MAIALVASVNCGGADTTSFGGTSAPIDTTGATLLAIWTAAYSTAGAMAFSDSKGNTWIRLNTSAYPVVGAWYYCLTPIVGPGHTFTWAAPTSGGTATYPNWFVYAFAGVSAYHSQNYFATVQNPSPLRSGVVTPPIDGALILTGLVAATGLPQPIVTVAPAEFALSVRPFVSLRQDTAAAAYFVQGTAATIDTVWSWTDGGGGGALFYVTANTVVFLPIPPAPPGPFNRLSQLPIEIASGVVIGVSQLPVEVALGTVGAPGAPLRLSQIPIEIAITEGARLSQAALEIATRPPGETWLSQLPIEIATGGAPGTRVSQTPLEVALYPDPSIRLRLSQVPMEIATLSVSGWRVTIDGADRTDQIDAVTVTAVTNERARATVVVADWIPDLHDEIVIYAKDGITRLFGGIIITRQFTGRNQYDRSFTVSLECGGYFTYADWLYATGTFDTPVTLKQALEFLVYAYLGTFGIVLHPAQADGPSLAPFLWQGTRVSDAIRELSDRTGYVARISGAKVLQMFLPGSTVAPFALTEEATHCQNVSWVDTDRASANKVTIVAGPTGQQDVNDERHYSDGVSQIFPLYAPYITVIGALYVFSENRFYDVGIYGQDDLPYTYDAATNAIRQHAGMPPLAAGDGFSISYGAAFPFQVTAATGETPIIEYSEAHPDVLSIPAAQELANQLLQTLSGAAPREVAIVTDDDGFEPGQALLIDLPVTRSISGTFTITEVAMTIIQDTGPDDEYLAVHPEGDRDDEISGLLSGRLAAPHRGAQHGDAGAGAAGHAAARGPAADRERLQRQPQIVVLRQPPQGQPHHIGIGAQAGRGLQLVDGGTLGRGELQGERRAPHAGRIRPPRPAYNRAGGAATGVPGIREGRYRGGLSAWR